MRLTLSHSVFRVMNDAVREAAIVRVSPVRGFRPWRGAQSLVANVPNPVMATVSPLASASVMTENMALTVTQRIRADLEPNGHWRA